MSKVKIQLKNHHKNESETNENDDSNNIEKPKKCVLENGLGNKEGNERMTDNFFRCFFFSL